MRVIFAIVTALAAVTTAASFMKRHGGKGKYTACALLAAVMLFSIPMTAYAKGDDPDLAREIDLSEILIPVVTPEPTPMLYKMTYHVREDMRLNHQSKKSEPVAWDLRWSVYTNPPANARYGLRSRITPTFLFITPTY